MSMAPELWQSSPASAAERRQNRAHGASRGPRAAEGRKAPEGRKKPACVSAPRIRKSRMTRNDMQSVVDQDFVRPIRVLLRADALASTSALSIIARIGGAPCAHGTQR